jgi:hypothetical protein
MTSLLALLVVVLAVPSLQAQSLGELARQTNERRAFSS